MKKVEKEGGKKKERITVELKKEIIEKHEREWFMMWTWALLPITLAVFGTVGILAVFGIAVSNETVNLTVEFPYISTCGTYNPQSCLFSQICNICCMLALWIISIRFQQVKDMGCVSAVNTASIFLGFISSIGISILGNFQQSVVFGAHVFGVFLAFTLGIIYFWLQVWLTYHAEPSHDRKWTGPSRFIFCSICTCLCVVIIALHYAGYRSASAMCEWALVMCFLVLFAIFSAEFRHIDFHKLQVQQNQQLVSSTTQM